MAVSSPGSDDGSEGSCGSEGSRFAARVAHTFASIDSDGTGSISFAQLLGWWRRCVAQAGGGRVDDAALREAQASFVKFDANENGRRRRPDRNSSCDVAAGDRRRDGRRVNLGIKGLGVGAVSQAVVVRVCDRRVRPEHELVLVRHSVASASSKVEREVMFTARNDCQFGARYTPTLKQAPAAVLAASTPPFW